ncbi:MAG: 2-C-methyl-D-erythritol 2,4-cyclodiphosphate synthase [Gammaproteobacteria bacterium CG_4_10_14_0_8_um_filter_38_16]|nr:MAG: 2-C-methyl-D-erythritol 2,4-cyclodiphosphate synthase [Gammaproteobacteria bacterium CG_4_10_14_0_8_um_filter_38_16]PJA02778.1 MAG: 2-C-methyl-D-erythritol 2,4-cyclodiphosphate synthase [Gammaproteobacteria bacterium CG_4_10_14_0_2_um_filter_38_22]PJB10731.1 MAG: 2-C-methyl-D-erythritol 2,4-cyclodiphosphate synthase [Gammaproteobacteria bacterium CG_4_9_14_3_um_filter_38_9]
MNSTHFDYLSGIGFDVHALKPISSDHFLFLCGVKIPARYEIIAHSDGDVALHALVDALLGAIGAGDIGEHFPPTDPRWKNADSIQFVQYALQLCREKNAVIVNTDITLICEQPKITPFKKKMREKLVSLLQLDINRINVKATTTEKLGFLGRSEGIAAQAIVSIKIPV